MQCATRWRQTGYSRRRGKLIPGVRDASVWALRAEDKEETNWGKREGGGGASHLERGVGVEGSEVFALVEQIIEEMGVGRHGVGEDGVEDLESHTNHLLQQGEILQLPVNNRSKNNK